MKLYRITIKLNSSLITPLKGDIYITNILDEEMRWYDARLRWDVFRES